MLILIGENTRLDSRNMTQSNEKNTHTEDV